MPVHLSPELGKVAAQHKRCLSGTSALRVIAGAPPYLAEPGPTVEAPGWLIGLFDLEKQRPNTETGKPSHVQIEQRPRNAATAPPPRHSDRQDFRFIGRHARENEACKFPTVRGTVRDDALIEQQPLELILAPATAERGGMQGRECGSIARSRFAQGRLAGRKQPGEEADHRRGNRASSCGRASGGRR